MNKSERGKVNQLSPGGLERVGNADVPEFIAQYAAKKACAELISAVTGEQADLTEELIVWLTAKERFWQAHVARAGASDGQRDPVRPMTA